MKWLERCSLRETGAHARAAVRELDAHRATYGVDDDARRVPDGVGARAHLGVAERRGLQPINGLRGLVGIGGLRGRLVAWRMRWRWHSR